jgi:thiol-disulfide isomerase/thioredoxin
MADKTLLAPEFPDTLEWINTKRPLQLSALRGKIIILEFWTSGSIACMHLHADLRYLQNKYRDQLLVISIHSPKFPHDKLITSVQKSVNRLHIKYPVAHDMDKRMSRKYGVKAWPAIVLIDATGRIIGRLQGEGKRRHLDELLKQYIDAAEQKNLLVPGSVSIQGLTEPPAVVNFPSKLLASNPYIYISDSGHNRVVEINHFGRVTRVFGSGGAGLLDGTGRDAAFNNPQGLALTSNFLYVADCGNHAIRRIDLQTQDIQTIAGNGAIGDTFTGKFTDPAVVSLNSPRDLCYHDGVLYIAMAGQHQLWKLRLTDNILSVLAGSGHIGLQDGKADEARFAQPCGITVDDYRVYTCDAESSAIRMLRTTSGQVSTLIGQGLSVSGDVDSGWSKALLQHPQAIAIDTHRQQLYVADSYNNKIKVMDFELDSISTVDAGHGLDEPDGLSLYDNTLWIANTNAHEIRKLNLLTREVEVLELNEPEQDF